MASDERLGNYDASDEIEYGINWFAWILREGVPAAGLSARMSRPPLQRAAGN
jgi:hypothetical protein